MSKKDLDSPELFINRELSWLEFNERVLREGLDEAVPLLERLKFLAIVSSNLDEFFMIRVAGLKQAAAAGTPARDPSGLSVPQQLAAVSQRVHRMVSEQAQGIKEALAELARHELCLVSWPELSSQQQAFLHAHFAQEILPVLTPLATETLEPFPILPGLRLNLALLLEAPDEPAADARAAVPAAAKRPMRVAIVPLPPGLPRFVSLPAQKGLHLAWLEEVVAQNVGPLFPGQKVLSSAVFRLTRDGDVAVSDEADDLLAAVEAAVRERRRRSAVRLELSASSAPQLRQWLKEKFAVEEADVYDVPGMLDAAALMEVANRPGFEKLKNKDWPPQSPRDLLGQEDPFQALQEHDVLLCHPYDSFEPVLRLLRLAASDPNVLAIKQTLYRTSGDSPIIDSLALAAESGKQVTVLVELLARFDEAKNITWARRLEEAGCHVIYGIAGYKTHAKLLLIIRREPHGIRRYVHTSTGNYNDRTARLYADVALMTTDRDVASDASAFFNLLTGYSSPVGWSKLAISPTGIRRRFEELIEREVLSATPDMPGLILAKMNSLEDEGMIRALYRASQAGVQVRLSVRGICCLRPGVEGVSENIEVVSVIDRFLEHARIFYFRNGGHQELYLSSADWMERNLDKRLEVLCPVQDERLQARLIDMLQASLADNVKGRCLRSDGSYERPKRKGPAVRAQEKFCQDAVAAAQASANPTEFRPLTRPRE